MARTPSAAEKQAVWQAYYDRRPTRTPLRWNTNVRIILLNPDLNPEGWTFEEYWYEPEVTLAVQARHQEYIATMLSLTCDASPELPERWSFRVDNQNTYDGTYFGSPLEFSPDQCPSALTCLSFDDADEFLARDFSAPLENKWLKTRLAYRAELVAAAKDFSHAGRGGDVQAFSLGFDGPVTVGATLFGADFFALMGVEPEKAQRVLTTITHACFERNRALAEMAGGWNPGPGGFTADDSIQLISVEMFEEMVLPLLAWWYDNNCTTPASEGKRSIHLCGDATRHFPLLHERLGVTSFDTGFPVDFRWLRDALGPDVEVSGGPHVDLLQRGTPEACYARAKEILESGIREGGRFILQEGNNLPPCCPFANLHAVYEACQDHGRFEG